MPPPLELQLFFKEIVLPIVRETGKEIFLFIGRETDKGIVVLIVRETLHTVWACTCIMACVWRSEDNF